MFYSIELDFFQYILKIQIHIDHILYNHHQYHLDYLINQEHKKNCLELVPIQIKYVFDLMCFHLMVLIVKHDKNL